MQSTQLFSPDRFRCYAEADQRSQLTSLNAILSNRFIAKHSAKVSSSFDSSILEKRDTDELYPNSVVFHNTIGFSAMFNRRVFDKLN